MAPFYTRTGDEGNTGMLGDQRIPKHDILVEFLGTLDEASAAIGLARAQSQTAESQSLLLQIQRHLYAIMAEAAATPETVQKFRQIGADQVSWLEEQIDRIGNMVIIPEEFILPGDSLSGACVDLARTIVRRAERRWVEKGQKQEPSNPYLLQYLNRLSSFLFVLELLENSASGKTNPSLAKSNKA